jgi:trimeric autotransporter adhesin
MSCPFSLEALSAMYRSGTSPRLRFHTFVIVWLTLATCVSTFGVTTTTTSLTLTSSGNQVSSVSSGTTITLTASVVAGSTAVEQGQVSFCDATSAYCTDIHLLGTAQLDSSGKAQLQLRPGPGSYSYKAIFLGTPKATIRYSGSVSSSYSLTVAGEATTATTITQGGSSANYTLTASVFGFTKSPTLPNPTGSVAFLDTTTNNSSLGMANLNPVGGLGWVNIGNADVGNEPGAVVTGDFNGDGNLDLAVSVNTLTTTVAILLGDGRGNFSQVTSNPITAVGSPVLVQDFNQDGIPDLLLSSSPESATMTVLLGNGDGTFTVAPGSPMVSNYGAYPLFVADFNGDGILDLATSGGYYSTMWLGHGDGSFTEMPITNSTLSAVSGPVGDFNNDGIPDLIDFTGPTVSVYLGKGDGTFKPAINTTVNVGSSQYSLAAADFNGDGKLDLAIAEYGDPSSLFVFLGNGDGTFAAAPGSPTQVGLWASRIAVGDFNGDGIADLIVNNATSPTDLFVALGNGDGTFALASTGSTQLPCCLNFAAGDFNGDGVTDIVSSDFYNGTADVFLTGTKQSSATVGGISVSGQSPQNVIASYPGDSNYISSQSPSTALMVQAAAPAFAPSSGGTILLSQTITITSSTPGASIYYQSSDGSTGGWTPYVEPISVYATGTVTIQAYATSFNYGQSTTSIATYTVLASNPVPTINSLSPALAVAGSQGLAITVNGSFFSSGATAYWGSTALTTQFVSSAQITAQITSAQLAAAGVNSISVQNPAPGGGTSNVLQFEIDSSGSTPPSFATTSATVSAGSIATYPVTFPASATNISVNCLNLPAGANCAYSASTGVLTIATSSSTPLGAYQITAVFTETLPGAAALASATLLCLPLAFTPRKRKNRIGWLWILIVGLLVASGCGSGSGGGSTRPQTHQATSSGVLTLNVQ